jgi:hypothetical protein
MHCDLIKNPLPADIEHGLLIEENGQKENESSANCCLPSRPLIGVEYMEFTIVLSYYYYFTIITWLVLGLYYGCFTYSSGGNTKECSLVSKHTRT